jgi:hypothetical protein
MDTYDERSLLPLPQPAYPLEPSFRMHRHDAEPAGLHLTSRQDTSWLFDVPSIYAKLLIAEQTVLANWR